MTALKKYIPIILLLLQACTEKIDLELGDTYERLVVEATITDRDSFQKVILSRTTTYLSNQPAPMVTDARVSISDGNSRWLLQEHRPGHYSSAEKHAAQAGTMYHLEIEYQGRTYRASSFMKPVAAIDSLTVRPHPFIPNHHELIAHFQEPRETTDFYMWRVFLNDEELTNTILRRPVSADDLINGQYLSLPFYTIRPEDEVMVSGNTIRVEMYNISYEYYLFLIAMRRNQGSAGGPFAGPPANIPGNIDNGAMGFFLAASVSGAAFQVR